MHELSIAVELVKQIVDAAEKNRMTRIDAVEVQTGVLRMVVPEMMQTAFKEATSQTLAQEASLVIEEVPAKAQCNQCHLQFEPEVNDFLCPQCHLADVKILEGDEIILKSISCLKEGE